MSSAEENSDQGDEVYVVEAILNKRIEKGAVEYLIKWKGYDKASDNTWEPEENCQCPELIEQFEKNWAQKEKDKKGSRGKNATKSLEKRKRSSEPNRGSRASSSKREDVKENLGNESFNTSRKNKSKEVVSSDSENEAVHAKNIIANNCDIGQEPFLPEPSPGRVYKIDEGKVVDCILGVKKGTPPIGMVALVRYEDNSLELIPTSVLGEKSSKNLINFYESKLRFY